ncbi:MAG: T9SS type A sorting domain-containing protein, partial [Ignavibacteriaceae bacterium]|jgi:hypothetical protein|nr:T9SS type A sorting domain-containing protein [Ignavibacteriaceae bacterium]
VQDLSLLQNIILTGFYPNGVEINACSYVILSKQDDISEDKITFYINSEGITIYSDVEYDILAAQLEFDNFQNNTDGLYINTELGEGYYQKVNNLFRVLLYDRSAKKIVQSGKHLIADIPLNISNPELITINKLILINTDRQKITNSKTEIIYGNAPTLPLDYVLYQNYPNPFNPMTTIQYSIPKKSIVSLKVYDLLGTEIATLVQEEKNRGVYSVDFEGFGMSSGVYFYRLQADEFVQTKKMLYLK